MTQLAAVDLGFGLVKGMTPTSRVSFPSYACPYKELPFESTREIREPKVIKTEDGEFFFGEDALLQERIVVPPLTQESRVESSQSLALYLAALTELGVDSGEVYLVVGLPVHLYRPLRERLRDFVAGVHVCERLDKGLEYEYNISGGLVMPQGWATLIRYLLKQNNKNPNPREKGAKSVVMNIGFRDVNLVYAEGNGKEVSIVGARSDSRALALVNAFQAIIEDLETEYDLQDKNPYSIIHDIVNRWTWVAGRQVDMGEIVDRRLEGVKSQIFSFVDTLCGNLKELRCLIVTGGGSMALRGYLQERWGPIFAEDALIFEEEPLFSECAGFLAYGKIRLQAQMRQHERTL